MKPIAAATRHFFRSSLGHVHFVTAGPTGETPILLLHQTPRSMDEFAEIIPILARDRRVIAIDTPGYGCSDTPAHTPTIAQYCAVVFELLDVLGIARAGLAGHHTGAILALEAAATQPERIEKIALSGPVYVDEAMRKQLSAIFVQWHVQADGSHLTEKWEKFSKWVDDPQIVQRVLVDLFSAGETSEQGHFSSASYHMEDRLAQVRCPALIILGTRDPFATPELVKVFHDTLREVRQVQLEGGVFLPNEQPRAFAKSLAEFF